METPPPEKSRVGLVLLINLGLIVVLHVGRQLIDSSESIFLVLFGLAFIDGVTALLLLVLGERKNSLGFFLAGLLVFIIGFGDCATHLKLGNMH